MSEQPLSLDELRKTRAELVAWRQLGVENGYDRAVRMVDGLLADLDAAERVFHRLNGQEQLLEGAEEAICREQEIVDEMKEHPVLTRQQAEARIDARNAERDRWRAKEEAEDERVRQYVRALDSEVTIRDIKEATGHRNTTTIWSLCKEVASEGLIEPMSRYRGFATRVVPPGRRRS